MCRRNGEGWTAQERKAVIFDVVLWEIWLH
jgi:hypothetical protein